MGFGNLRVINEDFVAPATGFKLHPHRNMEIITYIIDGELTHGDNICNKAVIKTGEVQIMSAGNGIIHSEWNYNQKECHLLQIWIQPNETGGEPSYKIYKPEHFEMWGKVASFNGTNAPKIKQNAEIYVINSGALKAIDLPNVQLNKAWLQVATGKIEIDATPLQSGDAIAFNNGTPTTMKFEKESKSLSLSTN